MIIQTLSYGFTQSHNWHNHTTDTPELFEYKACMDSHMITPTSARSHTAMPYSCIESLILYSVVYPHCQLISTYTPCNLGTPWHRQRAAAYIRLTQSHIHACFRGFVWDTLLSISESEPDTPSMITDHSDQRALNDLSYDSAPRTPPSHSPRKQVVPLSQWSRLLTGEWGGSGWGAKSKYAGKPGPLLIIQYSLLPMDFSPFYDYER